jgi:hypothetical protein
MRPGHRAWRRPATSVSAFARTSIIALWGMKRLLALLVLGTTAHSKPAQAPRPYMLDQEIIKKTEMPTNSQTAIRIKLVSSGRLATLIGRTKISSYHRFWPPQSVQPSSPHRCTLGACTFVPIRRLIA